MSRFEGTWHYARQMAEGMMPVLRDMATITVKDDEHGNPETVKIELSNPNSPFLELSVDEKTDSDIAFSRNTEEESPIRGRLVILSAATPPLPAILIGSIHRPASGERPRGQGEDHNVDVFIAVKVG